MRMLSPGKESATAGFLALDQALLRLKTGCSKQHYRIRHRVQHAQIIALLFDVSMGD